MKVDAVVSSSAADLKNADKIILPGVGHFGSAMARLRDLDLIEPLNEAVLDRGVPVLGICLGMELMACHGDEGDARGLGWLDADSVKFRHADTARYKNPHMGWNHVAIRRDSRLMANVRRHAEFYFAHSYYLNINEPICLLGETEYEVTFPAIVEFGNVFGVQFHPEKSHEAGRRMLQNFVAM
jgi:glutamine amidotransferase